VKILYKILILFFCLISSLELSAQKTSSSLNPDSVIYRKSWEAGVRLSSNGFSLGAEFTKSKRYTRSLLIQTRFSYFWDPKEVKQPSPYGGGSFFSGDGYKSFKYGKQNTLFTLYAGVGQKFLLAEKGKKHGVQIFFKYAAGFSLAILKPYYLKVVDTTSLTYDPTSQQYYFSNTLDVGYNQGSNELFLNQTKYGDGTVVGASGFGKGWKLKALPGLHVEVGMEFDWAKNEGLIKALEVGVAADFYYKKVPVMIQNNKFLYPSVYVGFMLGKRKEH
jgi:hypothetical protein